MSEHFGVEQGAGEAARGDESVAPPPAFDAIWNEPLAERRDPWAAAHPAPSAEGTADPAEGPSPWPGASGTDEVPATGSDEARPKRRHRRLAGVGVALVVFGLAAGSAGYVLGTRGASPTSASPSNETFNLPFGSGGSARQSPGGFSIPIPRSGDDGSSGPSTSSTVPAKVRASESSLVDVNTTVDNGRASGAGTGIVLSSEGVVLTNNHVVDGATSITVTDLGNARTYQADVVGYDVHRDVAVLRLVGASGLTTAAPGNRATVGETVYAVGNAGASGGTPTVTSGSITGTNRSVTATDRFNGTSETIGGMLQTSAALISGDSGGALTTATGTVVGLNTAGSSSPLGNSGGFAIPIAPALTVAHQITAGDASASVHVGPTAMLGVDITENVSTTGAPVASVLDGTPAAAAGITAGSRIMGVAGHTVSTAAGLRSTMLMLRTGERVTLKWIDAADARHSAVITLATGPPQ